jgi:hypothetical protein
VRELSSVEGGEGFSPGEEDIAEKIGGGEARANFARCCCRRERGTKVEERAFAGNSEVTAGEALGG